MTKIWVPLLILLGLLTPFLALELGLRLIGYIPHYGDLSMYIKTADPRGYGLRPGWTGWQAGAVVRVNQLGLRGVELKPVTPGLTRRILILGDSIAFGDGLAEQDMLTTRLQAALSPYDEVITAGVPGYRTVDQWAQLQVLWPLIQPDLVVLLYFVDNDADLAAGIQQDRATGELSFGITPTLVHRISGVLHRTSHAYSFLRHRVRSLWIRITHQAPEPVESAFVPEHLGWQQSQAAMRNMALWCRTHGIPFLVASVGILYHLDGLDQLAAFTEQQGIPYRPLWRTMNVDRYFREYAIAFYDGHPNAKAVQLMAERLLPDLNKLLAQGQDVRLHK